MPAVKERPRSLGWAGAGSLRDLFVLVLDQPQLACRLHAHVANEETGDPLDVERPVGEICAGVWRAGNDPDLAGAPVGVVEPSRVPDARDGVRATVDEEQ